MTVIFLSAYHALEILNLKIKLFKNNYDEFFDLMI